MPKRSTTNTIRRVIDILDGVAERLERTSQHACGGHDPGGPGCAVCMVDANLVDVRTAQELVATVVTK